MAHAPEDNEAPCDEKKHRTDGVGGRQEVYFHLELDSEGAQDGLFRVCPWEAKGSR